MTQLIYNSDAIPVEIRGPIDGMATGQTTTPNGFRVGHSNNSQAISTCWNGLAASGSNASQDFFLMQKGSGDHVKIWQSGNLATDAYRNNNAQVVGGGIVHNYYVAGVNVSNHYAAYHESTNNYRQQWDIRANNTTKAAMRLMPDPSSLGNTTLWVGENNVHNKKLALYAGDSVSDTGFYGFGINSSTLRYQVPVVGNFHRFYGGTDEMVTMTNNRVGINNTTAPVDNLDVKGGGVFGTPVVLGTRNTSLIAGILNAGHNATVPAAVTPDAAVFNMFREGIAGVSRATTGQIRLGKDIAGLNANSRMSFWVGTGGTNTANTEVLRMSTNRPLWTRSLPVYANAGAASGGGLIAGDYYKSAVGVVSQL